VYVLAYTEFSGRLKDDFVVVAVSEDRESLELLIDEKKERKEYRCCHFRIHGPFSTTPKT
jgi:hypothetical protein